MARETTQNFEKGVDENYGIDKGDPSRLFRLQNARLHDRGNMLSVSRIEGAVGTSIFPSGNHTILDIIFGPNSHLFVYWTEDIGDVHVKILDVSDINSPVEINSFNLGSGLSDGELLQQGNTVFLSPSNHMINYIEGTYYLNETHTEYPQIQSLSLSS